MITKENIVDNFYLARHFTAIWEEGDDAADNDFTAYNDPKSEGETLVLDDTPASAQMDNGFDVTQISFISLSGLEKIAERIDSAQKAEARIISDMDWRFLNEWITATAGYALEYLNESGSGESGLRDALENVFKNHRAPSGMEALKLANGILSLNARQYEETCGRENTFLENAYEQGYDDLSFHGIRFIQEAPGRDVRVFEVWGHKDDSMDTCREMGSVLEKDFKDPIKFAKALKEFEYLACIRSFSIPRWMKNDKWLLDAAKEVAADNAGETRPGMKLRNC